MTKPFRNLDKPVTPLARMVHKGHRVLLDTTGHLWIDRSRLRKLCGINFLPRRFNNAAHMPDSTVPLLSLNQLFLCRHMTPAVTLLLEACPLLYRKAFPDIQPTLHVQSSLRLRNLALMARVDPHVLTGTFDQLYTTERMYVVSEQGFFTDPLSIRDLAPPGQQAVAYMIGCTPLQGGAT